jgi:hypothetical protein
MRNYSLIITFRILKLEVQIVLQIEFQMLLQLLQHDSLLLQLL